MNPALTNVFSEEDVHYILTLSDVSVAREKLNDVVPSGCVYFTIHMTDSLRSSLESRFGIDLSSVSEIPMRWIKGDTTPHVDVASSPFDNTYLVYLNNNPGEFILDTNSYPIEANTGFVFQEGITHSTHNTGAEPRLLVGPMNEFALPVGAPAPVIYYGTQNDAINSTNSLLGGNYTLVALNGFTSWLIEPATSTGSSPSNVVYNVGDTLNSDGTYALYPASPQLVCFVEGARILTDTGYKAIETLQASDAVVLSDNRIVNFRLKKMSFSSTNTVSAPYKIEAGAFGKNMPSATICLSPIHKIQLHKGVWISPERAAKINPKVYQYGVGEPVNYWHIACDDYLKDNLICEGLVVESLATNKNYTGPSEVYTWNDRLGGFTRPASCIHTKPLSK